MARPGSRAANLRVTRVGHTDEKLHQRKEPCNLIEFPVCFVDGCSAGNGNFGVFMREGELEFYSAILSPSLGGHVLMLLL